MYTVKLLNNDWEVVEIMDFEEIPRSGDYIYSREKKSYYIVSIVVHEMHKEKFLLWKIKRQLFSLIIKEFNSESELK